MASTKDKKKKRRQRRARPPPAVAVKATNVPKAIPTAILLEQQAFGRLIKNARTAGLEINQPVYDRYQENIHLRSVLGRHNRPDLGERLGYQARQMVRNLVVPRGHAPARERSQRIGAETIRAETIPATPAPAPAPRPTASPAREGEIEEGPTVTWAERMAEGAKGAIDLSDSPEPEKEYIKLERKNRDIVSQIDDTIKELKSNAPTRIDLTVPVEGREIEPEPLPKTTPEPEKQPGRLRREMSHLDPKNIIDTPPTRKRTTRSARADASSSSIRLTESQDANAARTPSRAAYEKLMSGLPDLTPSTPKTPDQRPAPRQDYEDLMNEIV